MCESKLTAIIVTAHCLQGVTLIGFRKQLHGFCVDFTLRVLACRQWETACGVGVDPHWVDAVDSLGTIICDVDFWTLIHTAGGPMTNTAFRTIFMKSTQDGASRLTYPQFLNAVSALSKECGKDVALMAGSQGHAAKSPHRVSYES